MYILSAQNFWGGGGGPARMLRIYQVFSCQEGSMRTKTFYPRVFFGRARTSMPFRRHF